MLVVLGLWIAMLWVATLGHPRRRWGGCTELGGGRRGNGRMGRNRRRAAALVLALWTGVPAILLFGCAFRLIFRQSDMAAPAG